MSFGRELGFGSSSNVQSSNFETRLCAWMDFAHLVAVVSAPQRQRQRRRRPTSAPTHRTSGVPRRRRLGAVAGDVRRHPRIDRSTWSRGVQ